MSVLEICQLKIKPSISIEDFSVLKSLVEVRSLLRSQIINTNSRFYQCIEDPTLVYIFGVWPTIEAHHDFLSSDKRESILSPQEDLLNFGWVMHMPLPNIELLPLDAPVLALAWFHVNGGDQQTEFQRLLDKYRDSIVDGSKPYSLVDGWRCDAKPNTPESFVISGWKSKAAHDNFTYVGMKDPEYASVLDCCDNVEVWHMKDMETSVGVSTRVSV